MTSPVVDIHYARLPDREDVFRQVLVFDGREAKVTLARDLVFEPTLMIDGTVALETGSCAVWFTFPGRWHDIGLFHRADGTFTGMYANILTPPVFESPTTWRTTDLFLDVWIDPEDRISVLDRDQFDRARSKGEIDAELARGALAEVDRILARHRARLWPPAVVGEWPLERALRTAGYRSTT